MFPANRFSEDIGEAIACNIGVTYGQMMNDHSANADDYVVSNLA